MVFRRPIVSSEEDLERSQEAFLTGSEVPAAKVTRTKPRQTDLAGLSQSLAPDLPASPERPTAQSSTEFATAADKLAEIFGEVKERTVVGAPTPPQLAVHDDSSAGFPAAKHRSKSKFIRLRNRGRHGLKPEIGADSKADTKVVEPAQSNSPLQGDAPDSPASIGAENLEQIRKMTPEKVQEARREITSSLSPDKLNFLRQRGAKKLGSSRVRTDSVPATAISERNGVAMNIHEKLKAQIASEVVQPKRLARARFSLTGEFLGFAEPLNTTAVLQRDPLRSTGEEGFSLHEACILARSSQAAQRTAACELLAAVILRARPTWQEACGRRKQPPANVQDNEGHVMRGENAQDSEGAAEEALDWGDIWAGLLEGGSVPTALRIALDDSSPRVFVAALQAIAALLGNSKSDALNEHGLLIGSGVPILPLQHLLRPQSSAEWEAYPAAAAARPDMQEEVPDEQAVAAEDPCAGLLQMQLIARIRYILAAPEAPAAVQLAVDILHLCVRSRREAAAAIVREPGLVATLLSILELQGPGQGSNVLAAKFGAQSQVLALLKAICHWDRVFTFGLLRQGLSTQLKRFAIRGLEEESSRETLAKQVEALCIWRICADQGINVLPLESVYTVLCQAFVCPATDKLQQLAARTVAIGNAEANVTVTARLWELAAALLRQQSLDKECALNLATEARSWLSGCSNAILPTRTSAELDCSRLPSANLLAVFAAVADFLTVLVTEPKQVQLGWSNEQDEATAEALSSLQDDKSGHNRATGCLESLMAWSLQSLHLLRGSKGPSDACDLQARTGLQTSGIADNICIVIGQATVQVLHSLVKLSSSLAERPVCLPTGFRHDFCRALVPVLDLQPELREAAKHSSQIAPHEVERQQLLLPFNLLRITLLQHLLTEPEEASNDRYPTLMLMMPCLLPPGCEYLALDALTLAFSSRSRRLWLTAEALPNGLAVDEASRLLLTGYAAAALGMLSEGSSEGNPASNGRFKGSAAATGCVDGSGSLLPLKLEWLYSGPAQAVVLPGDGLDTVAEESETEGVPSRPYSQPLAVECALACMVGMESGPSADVLGSIPAGRKIRALFDLIFDPAADDDTALWREPPVQRLVGRLLDLLASHWPVEAADSIPADRAATWAALFATSSFGDAFFARCMGFLLHPQVPSRLRAAVLDELEEHHALHLVPAYQP